MKKLGILTKLAALAVLAAGWSTNEARARVNAGTLTCDVDGGYALILAKPRHLHCVFHKRNGRNEAYKGKLNEHGLSFGSTKSGVISWRVFAPTSSPEAGTLSGHYQGVRGRTTSAARIASTSLFGGSNRSIILEPLTVRGNVDANIAVGISSVSLHPLFRGSAHELVPSVGHAPAVRQVRRQVPSYGCGSYTHLERGQTLSGLARSCNVSLSALLDANQQITNVRAISAGALVHLPGHTGQQADSSCGQHAVLKDGESLERMAWRCGVTMHALLVANPMIRDSHHIRPGLVLTIPQRSTRERVAPVVVAATRDQLPNNLEERLYSVDFHPRPGASSDDDHLSHDGRMRLEQACIREAQDRYGFEEGQIHATESHHAGHNSISVSLSARGQEAVCLIGDNSNVQYVSELSRDTYDRAFGYHNEDQHASTTGSAASAATGARTEQVRFSSGASSATIRGSVSGYGSVNYALHGFVGQDMSVRFDPDNNSCFFNVLPPSGTEAMFNGSILGNRFDDRLPTDGDYTVQTYLMRNAARENQTCQYTINFRITGEDTAAVLPAGNSGSATRVAERACLQAVADQVGISRSRLSIIEVLNSEAGIGVTVRVPDANAPWSCLSDADGNVQGASFTGDDSAGVAILPADDDPIPQPAARDTESVTNNACLAAARKETGEPNIQVTSNEFSEANTLVMLGVGTQRAPWRCLVSNRGQVAELSFQGDDSAGVADQTQSGSDVSAASVDACIGAVSGETGESNVSVVSTEFSEANSLVVVGVGEQQAPWRCLVSNDGIVQEITSQAEEGKL